MAKKFPRMYIDGSIWMNYDIAVVDRYKNELIYASIVASDALLKNIAKSIKKKVTCTIESRCTCLVEGAFTVNKEKYEDYSHMTIKKNDIVDKKEENEKYIFYMFYRDRNELLEAFYDKIYQHTPVPFLKQWSTFVYEEFNRRGYITEMSVYHNYNTLPLQCVKLEVTKNQISDLITYGLSTERISIMGVNGASSIMKNTVNGLDSYLNIFGDTLAEKIQQAFVPKFNPKEEEYDEYINNYDDSCFYNGIELYEAQKSVIQAVVNNLDKNKVSFIIGEMGTGKTAMGAGIAYCHYKQKAGSTSIIMCPSHLVEKWKREVEKFVPNAKAYIVTDISELMALERKIKDKIKREHTFIVLSKESAKFSYETRPAVVWSRSKRCFVCPECGQYLYKEVTEGTGSDKWKREVKLGREDFLKEYAYNTICKNKVWKINKSTNQKYETDCNCRLWTPLNRYEKYTQWIKLGADGWIMKKHLEELYTEYNRRRNQLNKKEQAFLLKLIEKKNEIEETGEATSSTKGVRKYSIAKYVRERLKGHIDYCLLDELHEYKAGDSEQGQAMGDLAAASNKVIGLTGTLLDGYAKGLFYLLYRTMPQLMRSEGFDYSSETAFQREYGVMKKTSNHAITRGGKKGEKLKTSSDKPLPGVSPLVFTKFLLENAVFISISDMAEGLPEYTEIPVPVIMDTELRMNYDNLEGALRSLVSWKGAGGAKALGLLIQTLLTYPDMPYGQVPILHPDTGEVLCTPVNLSKGLRNKEEELLTLVQERIEEGEKVLIYYEFTNKTDVADKLIKALEDNGIKAINLTSTSATAKNREEWINKQLEDKDIKVMLCNPNLVKTGLDLLEFTSIIFYQMRYNLFTLRQASRRSYRLNQTKDIKVYFMYYKDTVQEQAMALMASKLQASMALEGKFSEEGLRAMADNEDILSKVASSVVEGIKNTVDAEVFTKRGSENNSVLMRERMERERKNIEDLLIRVFEKIELSFLSVDIPNKKKDSPSARAMKSIINGKISINNDYKCCL